MRHESYIYEELATLVSINQNGIPASDLCNLTNANQPGIHVIWPSVYMHSGNLDLCNVTSV